MIEVFLLVIALIWLIFASVSDFKTREVPDWLSYSLIAIGFSSALLKSIVFKDLSVFYSVFAFGIMFLVSLLLYYTKQWGGGDVKLLIGLFTLFPIYPLELLKYFNPNLQLPFILIFLINLAIIGAIYSLFYGGYLLIKNKINLVSETKKYKMHKSFVYFPLLLLLISIIVQDVIIKLLLLSLGFIILVTPILFIYIKIIENKCMFKKINVNSLTEGDWITHNIYYKGKLIYNKNSPGVVKKDIDLLKKIKIRYVIVKEGIPFIPSFLIAFIITIIFGNLLRI